MDISLINIEKMAILKSCCCWKSVRSGSFASGIYTLVEIISLWFMAMVLLTLMTTMAGVQPKKATTTVPPPGVWGEWGPWDEHCSVTCGIGTRRRTRKCSYEGRVKSQRCKGPRGKITNCDTKITCPVDGGWSSWAAWECTVTCGGGQGKQMRECNNPKPMFGGKQCEGSDTEEGKCNEERCPDQVFTLPPATANSLKESIDKGHYNFEKKEGETVKIPCRSDVVNNVYKAYPNSVLSWIKNGAVLQMDIERMKMTLSELTISKLKSEDNGVYVCSINYAPNVVKPVSVAVMTAIASKPNVFVHADEKLTLICNGAHLAAIYGNLTQTWLHNNVEVLDFGKGLASDMNRFDVPKATPNMTGTWACRVKGTSGAQASKSWITNVLLLKVLPPLKLHHKLLNNVNLMLSMGIVVLVVIIASGTYFSYVVQKTRDEYMLDFEKWCLIAKLEGRKSCGAPKWAGDSRYDWYVTDSNDYTDYSDGTDYEEGKD